jgi:hypothetical protein
MYMESRSNTDWDLRQRQIRRVLHLTTFLCCNEIPFSPPLSHARKHRNEYSEQCLTILPIYQSQQNDQTPWQIIYGTFRVPYPSSIISAT